MYTRYGSTGVKIAPKWIGSKKMKWFRIAILAAVFVGANAALLSVAWTAQAATPTGETTQGYILPEGVDRFGVSDIRQ